MTQYNADVLDQLDQLVGSVVAPAHVSHGPVYLPAPMASSHEEIRRAAGPTFTVSITDEAKRFIAARRDARDAAVSQVVATYRADKKPGNTWERRQNAMAAISATIPDRDQAERRSAEAVACAVEDTWASVLAELRSLYPDTVTKG